MLQFKKKSLIISALIILFFQNLPAQVTGQLTQSVDKKRYQFSIIPDKTITRPNNITNTAQITFKATAGSFEVTKVTSITGVWQYNSIIKSPIEAPDYDYIVFSLATPLTDPNYQINTELPLFSFENQFGCNGSLELIENFIDPFWPPNDLNVNIGTQITILEYGFMNAYEKNDPNYTKIDCPNSLEFYVNIDSAKCGDQKGLLTIYLNDGDLPFNYEIFLENGEYINGALAKKGDSVQIGLLAGHHQLLGYDQRDTGKMNIVSLVPSPLNIEVVNQEKITCRNPDGATVEIKGTGGWSENNLQYKWSNGMVGKKLTQLPAANYTVTLSNGFGCSITKEITIEQDPPIQIDSIELYPPSCHNTADGMIELIDISNGTPPFQYTLNERGAQSTNYFENLKAGPYRINVTDSKNCVTGIRVDLIAPPKLEISTLNLDSVLIAGQATTLQPKVNITEDINYNWSPITYLSCFDCPTPIAKPIKDITYTLEIANQYGCTASISRLIKVLKQRPVFVPNVFSPNGDGNNDEFKIFLGPSIKFGKSIQIFNRWGQLIYSSKSAENGIPLVWDGVFKGKQVDSGVYLYLVEIVFDDGTTQIYKGDFFLLK